MSEFPVDSAENGDMAAVMENFQKKNALRPQVTGTSATQVSHRVHTSSTNYSLPRTVAHAYVTTPNFPE